MANCNTESNDITSEIKISNNDNDVAPDDNDVPNAANIMTTSISASNNNDSDSCSICLNEFHDGDVQSENSVINEIVITTKCGHLFHRSCWIQYYKSPKKSVCPVCRTENCAPDNCSIPHKYTVDVIYNDEFDVWDVEITENFYFDFAGNKKLRNELVYDRFVSSLRHIWTHQYQNAYVNVCGSPSIILEVFQLRNQYSHYIISAELCMVVKNNFAKEINNNSNDDINNTNNNEIDDTTTITIPNDSYNLELLIHLYDC